jgi:4a-hydroxytetrahydrobiopterin dehydratase
MALALQTEISAFLEEHPEWERVGDSISRTYEFEGFSDAIGFVAQVALLAERADHHPDIDIRWNKVSLALSTHSEGGITARDIDLAAKCDSI